MPAGTIENNSKGNSTFFDANIYSNKNVCPFTMESVRDCKTRNSFFDSNVCFFMLETCYFSRQGKLKKIVCRK